MAHGCRLDPWSFPRATGKVVIAVGRGTRRAAEAPIPEIRRGLTRSASRWAGRSGSLTDGCKYALRVWRSTGRDAGLFAANAGSLHADGRSRRRASSTGAVSASWCATGGGRCGPRRCDQDLLQPSAWGRASGSADTEYHQNRCGAHLVAHPGRTLSRVVCMRLREPWRSLSSPGLVCWWVPSCCAACSRSRGAPPKCTSARSSSRFSTAPGSSLHRRH